MTRYVVHRDGAGELEGLWIGDVRQADDAFIGEVLARHGVRGDVTTSRYRVIRNTFNDRGGVFVRFVGDETTAEAGALPRRELVVSGTSTAWCTRSSTRSAATPPPATSRC